jgi:hypothetical protein
MCFCEMEPREGGEWYRSRDRELGTINLSELIRTRKENERTASTNFSHFSSHLLRLLSLLNT